MERRRRLLLAGAVGAAVVAVVVAVGLVVGLGGDGDDGAGDRTGELLDPPVGLEAERDEALALIRRGQDATYHARYESTGDPLGALPRLVEVWRKAGRSRTDMEYAAGGGVERSVSIRRPPEAGGAVTCRRAGEGPWTCQRVDDPPSDLFEEATVDLAYEDVVARDDQVRGRAARCFALEAEEGTGLCFDADGVLLRLSVGEGALELASLEPVVDDRVFEPPA